MTGVQDLGHLARLIGADQHTAALVLPVLQALYKQLELAAEAVHWWCLEAHHSGLRRPRDFPMQHIQVNRGAIKPTAAQMPGHQLGEGHTHAVGQAQVTAQPDTGLIRVVDFFLEVFGIRPGTHWLVHHQVSIFGQVIARRLWPAVDIGEVVYQFRSGPELFQVAQVLFHARRQPLGLPRLLLAA